MSAGVYYFETQDKWNYSQFTHHHQSIFFSNVDLGILKYMMFENPSWLNYIYHHAVLLSSFSSNFGMLLGIILLL